MKSWRNHIRKNNFLSVALTTIVLLFVACGPTVQWLLFSSSAPHADYQTFTKQQKNADTSQDSSSEGKDHHITKVSAASEAVIPICKIQIAFCCSFIRIFSFQKKIVANEVFAVPLPQSHYFRTLFRRIISPNAP